MVFRKDVVLGAGALLLCAQVSFAASSPSTYVSALPTPQGQTVKAQSVSTTVQPSASPTTPPRKLSTALGLGPQSRININGFLSAGASSTNTSANYVVPGHGEIDNHWNASANSLVGLQFTAQLANSLQAVTQLIATGDNTNGDIAYRVNAEWAFLRFSYSSNYQVRIGRFRIPTFLYSETEQVGYSYPWVQLPNEVYRIVPFDNINGVNILYRHPLGNSGWNLTIEPFYGSNDSKFTIHNQAAPTGVDVDFREDALKGGVVSVGNDNMTVRGTYATLKLTGQIPGQVKPLFSSDTTTYLDVALKWNVRHFIVQGEYARRSTPSQIAALTGYYGSIGWRIGKLTPIFTYAHIKTTNAHELALNPLSSELPQDQQSYTLGLDYTLNTNLASKISVSQITPLNGTSGLFDSNPRRKHILLYGVSLDAIF
jgi:hypothetical protein